MINSFPSYQKSFKGVSTDEKAAKISMLGVKGTILKKIVLFVYFCPGKYSFVNRPCAHTYTHSTQVRCNTRSILSWV